MKSGKGVGRDHVTRSFSVASSFPWGRGREKTLGTRMCLRAGVDFMFRPLELNGAGWISIQQQQQQQQQEQQEQQQQRT